MRCTPLITCAALLSAAAMAQTSPQVEPGAGTWKTWVLSSGREFRPAAPPTGDALKAELQWLKEFVTKNDPGTREQVRFWDSGAPSYRWMEMVSARLRDGRLGVSVPSFRAYSLVSVAMYDATIAAWDAKYSYKQPRPAELDATLAPLVATPRSPSFPSEHAVTAAAAATVLAYLFPADAAYYESLAEEAARSRLFAGVQFPSDVIAGLELGRAVGRKVVEHARSDSTDAAFTGVIPTGPGFWVGSNPGFATAPLWKPWFLGSANEFRPQPPPAHDSSERAGEIAELKAMQRNFNSNANAFFWQTVDGVHCWFFDSIHRKLFESKLDANPPRAARAYALMGIVQFDAHIASNDAKYTYWTIRPSQQDTTLTTVFPPPNFPSYPSNHSCHSAARSAILAYLFPDEAEYFLQRGEEAGISRLWAGIHFRSDHDAGSAMGKAIANKLIAIAERDGSSGQSSGQ